MVRRSLLDPAPAVARRAGRAAPASRLSHLVRSEAFLLVSLTLFGSLVAFWPLLTGGFLFHDLLAGYSFFYDNLDSLNRFGESAWWSPQVNYGSPNYFFSLLGFGYLGKPLFVGLGLVAWILGRLGVALPWIQPLYLVHLGILVPLLFMVAVWLLARELFRSRITRFYTLAAAAFSPAMVMNVSDPGVLENLGYTILCASAFLRFVKRPSGRAFAIFVLTAALVSLGFGVWVLVTALPFLPLLGTVVCLSSRRARHALRGVPTLHWLSGGLLILVTALPSILTYAYERDEIMRIEIDGLQYPYEMLKSGNPLEFLLASTPGVVFQWSAYQQQKGAAPVENQAQPMAWGVAAGSGYLGALALPLAAVGLLYGRRRLRVGLFIMLVASAGVYVLYVQSPLFAPLLFAIPPIGGSLNHFGDLIYPGGGCIILLVTAALGVEALERRPSLATPLLVLLASCGAASLALQLHWGRVPQSLIGFHAGMLVSLAIVLRWLAGAASATRKRLLLLGLVGLSLLDLSTQESWYLRYTVRGDPADYDAGLGRSIGNRNPGATMIANMYPLRPTADLMATGMPLARLPAIAPFCSAHFYAGVPDQQDLATALDARRPSLPLPAALGAEPALATFLDGGTGTTCRATTQRPVRTYNSLAVGLNAEQPVLLFVRDSFSPFWQVRIDGVPSRVYRAFGAFKAAVVPAGSHTVVFRFEPPWLAAALWSAYCMVIALSAALLAVRFRGNGHRLRREEA